MIQIDIDMPEKCCLCPLFHAERPMYCQGVKADRKKKIVAPYGDPRPEWCPLHEVTADPDAVSREAIYDALGDTRAFYFDSDNGMVQATKDQTGYEGWYKVPDVFQTIDNLPPSPSRPHGQWIRHHEITDGNDIIKGYMCNQCKRVVEVHSWETLNEKYPFCHCGADMRGGKA